MGMGIKSCMNQVQPDLDVTLRVGAVRKILFYFCLPVDESQDRVLN